MLGLATPDGGDRGECTTTRDHIPGASEYSRGTSGNGIPSAEINAHTVIKVVRAEQEGSEYNSLWHAAVIVRILFSSERRVPACMR